MNDKLKCRLFLVSGPSQLLFLSAALTKDAALDAEAYVDILVFSAVYYPKEKKAICEEIATTVWYWSRIVWLPEIGYFNEGNTSEILSELSDTKPSQLWFCMPYGKVELVFTKHFYSTSIVRYDDGLGTYVIPKTLSELLKTPSFLKKQLNLVAAKSGRFMKDFLTLKRFSMPKMAPKKRYGLFASFVGSTVKSSKQVEVEWHYLKAQLEKFNLHDKAIVPPSEGNTCLIIGQYFSLLGFFDRKEELNHYKKLCQYLYSEGYKILWKEHPKNRKPFFNELKATFTQIEDFNNYHSSYWPLEVVVKNINIDLFIATTSTSIVVLDKVFGYVTKSSAPLMIDKLQGADKQVAKILVEHLNKEQLINKI